MKVNLNGLTVAFDLDGTLVETAPDLIRATNHVMALAGLAPVDGSTLRDQISFGSRAMIEHAFRIHRTQMSSSEVDRMQQRFLEFYASNIAGESHAYPGLEDALDRLAARGAQLVVCTNKQESLSRQLLDALDLSRRFAAIAGRDTFPVYKPHPDHLTGAIRLAGGDLSRAVMVGDSETDIKTARAARVPVIGVPFGYSDTPIYELGADFIIEHFNDLEHAIEQLCRT